MGRGGGLDWIGVLRGNWEAKCEEDVAMEFGRKFLGWREDGENGEGERAQSGFCGYGGQSDIPSLG